MEHPKLIDFHAHILPHADHGSDSTETSLKQIEILESHGIDTVVATPHFYPFNSSPQRFEEKRQRSIDRLLSKSINSNVKIAIGAEVLVCEGMEKMDGLDLLTISGTNTLLLEMPFNSWSDELMETVRRLTLMDFTVVLAHIDRYPSHAVDRLLDFDLYAQMNCDKLASFFGRRGCMGYINSKRVVALGSDIHGAHSKSVKNLVTAFSKIGKENAEYISSFSSRLLENASYIN